MNADRIHRAVPIDGTEIVARVHGEGPPLVMIPGGPGDGEFSFRSLLPHLVEHLTCYPVSTRSRGLSGTSEDYSLELLEADLRSFVESVGDRVVLMGWSSSSPLVLEVTSNTDAVSAVVLYEPTFLALRSQEVEARHQAGVERIITAVSEERLVDAARAFYEDLGMAEERELAALEAAGTFEQSAPNIPVMMQEALGGAIGVVSDMALLEQISVPVLILQGSTSQPYYASVVDHLAERLPDPHVRRLDWVGHFAPALTPEPVADEVLRFLSESSLVGSR